MALRDPRLISPVSALSDDHPTRAIPTVAYTPSASFSADNKVILRQLFVDKDAVVCYLACFG